MFAYNIENVITVLAVQQGSQFIVVLDKGHNYLY